MRLNLLRVRDLRGFRETELRPQAGLNLITGANGAGKTSLLEAIHLLAHGRSFRARVRDGLVRQGAPALEVYAEWDDARSGGHRGGLRHAGGRWTARLDGAPVGTLSELCAALAVLSFEPGSHELVTGAAEHRRRFLDWALFHVEPDFLGLWRRYARALRQRNVLLKTQPDDAALDPWDHELAESGEALSGMREAQLERWRPALATALQDFLDELGGPALVFVPGWNRSERNLADSLRFGRERDRALGHTHSGPHRADWRIEFPGLPGREALSRGQAKLVALACIVSQGEQYASRRGEWPLVCMDDLGSELDRPHQARVLERLRGSGAQVLMTGTEAPAAVVGSGLVTASFHVEHGKVERGETEASGNPPGTL